MTTPLLTPEDAERLVAPAVLAPSVLNTQPWLFQVHDDVVDVYLDTARTLPVIDPSGRAAVISCAAAVLNLRLGAQSLGRDPRVQLLPDADDEGFLARVRLAGDTGMTAAERALYEAIGQRHSNRLPFRNERLAAEVVAHLEEAADAEGGWLRVLTSWEVPDIVQAVHQADDAQRDDPRVRAEIGRWIERPAGAADGLTRVVLGPQPRDRDSVVRDFSLGYPLPGRETADFEQTASLAVLYTYGDTRMDWLRAGMALQRMLLAATTLGVAASMLTQALEVPALRSLLRVPAAGTAVPQVMLRLGYGVDAPASSRRPLREVLQYGS